MLSPLGRGAVIVFGGLLSAACKRSGEPAAAAGPPPPAVAEAAGPQAPPELLAISFDAGGESLELRPALMFDAPAGSGYSGTVAVFPHPQGQSARSIRFWSADTGRWESASFIAKNETLMFVAVPRVREAPPLPAGIMAASSPAGWSVEWDTGADPLPAPPKPPTDAAAVAALKDRHDALEQELEELRNEGSRPPRGVDPRTWAEDREQAMRRERDLRMEMSRLTREARAAGVILGSGNPSVRPSPAPTRPPKLVSAAAGDDRSAGLLFLPGRGWRSPAEPDAVFPDYAAVSNAVLPEPERATVWIEGGQGSHKLEAKCRITSRPLLASDFQHGLAVTPAGGPAPAEPQPTSRSGLRDDSIILSVDLPPVGDGNTAEFDLRSCSRGNQSEPWRFSKPARLLVRAGPEHPEPHWREDGGDFIIAAPPSDQIPESAVPVARTASVHTPTPIRQTAVGGSGTWVAIAVEAESRVRWFDADTLKEAGSLTVEGDPNRVSITADRDTLFVADRDGTRLRAIAAGDGSVRVEQSLPAPQPVLALAAGAYSSGPLLVATAGGLQLLDPPELGPLGEWITGEGAGVGTLREAGRLDGWNTSSLTLADEVEARAAPDGKAFELKASGGKRTERATLRLVKDPASGTWQTLSGQAVPGWDKSWFQGGSLIPDIGEQAIRITTGISHSLLLPCLGSGALAVKDPARRTVPPSPKVLQWVAGDESKSTLVFAAGAPARIGDDSRSTFLWFNPSTLGILSAGGNELRVEHLDREAWNTAAKTQGLRLVNRPDPARRGQPWKFQPLLADGSGMGDATVTTLPACPMNWSSGRLEATLPADLPGNRLTVTLTPATGAALVFTVPLEGTTPSSWQPSAAASTAIPADPRRIPITGLIDSLQMAGNDDWLLVASHRNTRLSLVDLKTLELKASRSFPGGPASSVVVGESVYRWHLTSGLLTRWTLPDFQPSSATGHLDGAKLLALAGGRGQGQSPLLALIAGKNSQLAVGRVDPQTLRAGPVDTLEGTSTAHFVNRDNRMTRNTRTSFDGKTLLIGPLLVRVEEGKPPVHQNLSVDGDGATLSEDGNVVFSGGSRVERIGGREWSPATSDRVPAFLVAGTGSSDFVAVVPADSNAGTRTRITLYNGELLEPRMTLEPVPEWDRPSRSGSRPEIPFAQSVLLNTKAGVLATVDAHRNSVVLRRIPAADP
jgi:hypothetical protein